MTASHEMKQYLERLNGGTTREYGYEGQTGVAFAAWQDAIQKELASVLGLPAIRATGSSDPAPERLTTETKDGYERQTWQIRTEPDFRVPFDLLLPEASEPPYPVVLAIHGHCEDGRALTVGEIPADRPEIAEERRDFARQAVDRGYAALAPDMRAFGDLAGPEPDADGYRSCTRLQKVAQLFGRTLAGERVWDILQLLEFVERRSVLDAERIGIVGHSGGAAAAMFAAALDDRLAPVALNSYFCTFDASIVAIDHCECNYVPGIRRVGEMWDVAGAIAPRPLAVVTGDEDPIFPVEGTRRAFDELTEIYAAADAVDACDLTVASGVHRFYPDAVWPFVDARL
ncbi:alpha/beta hydrolase family protein [Halopiger aswanensis]|uniref:Alpha/beta hydrolase family protein n=1 Tax=Halopiger aswanensis TaxID=148449 RepID=A0A3R7GG19_9EURY|nr:alpha/beta hydrolase family protein [Halopiger aswanensis]RKD89216.1 alpha/beta hydrolase family protein [Halopiger aswanensis]